MADHGYNLVLVELLAVVFWQMWWFKAGIVVAVTLFITGYHFRKIRKLKNQKAELQRQVNERSELLRYALEREKKTKEVAAQVNRSKGVLLARINHEIRTPLNGILGMTSLLGESSLNNEQQEYRDTIHECGENLLKVVNDILLNDILEYAKMDSGKMELEQAEFNLENTLEEVWDVFASKAAHNKIELVYHLDADVPEWIIGDQLRLKQILMNLVENSVWHTYEGTVFVNVHLVHTETPNTIELAFEVHDTGKGILPEKLKTITAALSTNKDASTIQSNNGVGLVICAKLTQMMGGNITIASKPGEGTTVRFTIRTSASLRSTRSNFVNELAALAGKRVLLVEDNMTHINFLTEKLSQLKVETVVVQAGADAFQFLENTAAIDLLITDNEVLDMDGVSVAQHVRQYYPQIPIMLLSPTGDSSAKQFPELFNTIVTKPVKKHILTRQIMHCLKNAKGLAAHEGNKLPSNFSEQYPLRILVAEDNITNQKLAMKVLGKLGYKTDVARHGKEVLDVVSHKKYDLILMDVQMPEMDGLEATRMIRLCLTTQPVIVAMTANTLQGDREACLQAGMDDYISKPINLDDLVNVLEKWAVQIKQPKM